MKFNTTADFRAELGRKVTDALYEHGIVNLAAIAVDMQRQHPWENLFDIEHAILGYANLLGAPVVFERKLSAAFEGRAGDSNQGLLLEIIEATDTDVLSN